MDAGGGWTAVRTASAAHANASSRALTELNTWPIWFAAFPNCIAAASAALVLSPCQSPDPKIRFRPIRLNMVRFSRSEEHCCHTR
ncbi:hypothetical protein C5E43_19860 [Nocardia cyriacigeorgica]|nr:hypothetical protein C5B73_07685 [Nocardia cyriacigeorgica]PPJ06845.1 hypothetical protein C5E43_19860 [Nocardia cyriacigeorgica]